MIRTGALGGQSFPRVVETEGGSPAALTAWLDEHQGQVDAWLLEHGAVLFRGFGIDDDDDFTRLSRRFIQKLDLYVEGNSPRHHTSEFVYTATNYPPEFDISIHNELSYAHTPPQRLFFYCQQPPLRGGQTPLASCRRALELLDPEVLDRFTRLGVCYTQNLHGGVGLGRSWQQTFETEDRGEVERYLSAGEVEATWLDNGGLRTRQVRPATQRHPLTAERVWFNQADQWHISNLDARSRRAIERFLSEDQYPLHAEFGDGTAIPPSDLDHIRSTLWGSRVGFDWRRGDALILDNYLVAHGRSAFTGPRNIRVAMGGSVAPPTQEPT